MTGTAWRVMVENLYNTAGPTINRRMTMDTQPSPAWRDVQVKLCDDTGLRLKYAHD